MDVSDPMFLRDADDALDVQIGADRSLAFSSQIGFIRFETVQAQAILLGIDRCGTETQFRRRAQNPDGDFAAISREKFLHTLSEF